MVPRCLDVARVALALGLAVVVPLAAVGCKRDQAGSQASASPGAPGDEHHHHGPMPVSSGPPIVSLQAGGRRAQVDLRTLPTETVQGRPAVRLAQVWRAAALGSATPARLDFVGDDGFRPGSKPKCPEKLAGSMLEHGFLDPATRNLTWDDEKLPGCYRVHAVATIEAVDP